MLTGHGPRLPGWPMDLAMAWAGTPTPFQRRSVLPPVRLALAEECTESLLSLRSDAQSSQPRGRFKGRSRSVPRRAMRPIAYQRLGLRHSLRCALEQRLDDARAGGVEQVVRYGFMNQPQILQGGRGQYLRRQKITPCGALADLAEHEGRNDRGDDVEAHVGDGEVA